MPGPIGPQGPTFRSSPGRPVVPRTAMRPADMIPLFGGGAVAAGAVSRIVSTSYFPREHEGVIVGYRFWLDSQNYQTSPFFFASYGAGTGSDSIGNPVFPGMTQPISPSRSEYFFYPTYAGGIFWRTGQILAVSFKNNEAVEVNVEASIIVQSWHENDRPAWVQELLKLGD